ncbi:MAG TPA: cold shock domain-containing protein [Rhizomicrobium sp.]|jgi:CspA family cold shock protein
MPNGTVKFFNVAKKFGFVSSDDGGKDVFIPIASVTAAGVSVLTAGQRVSFETAPDSRGPKAVNLKLIGAPAPAPAREKTPLAPSATGSRKQLTFYYDPASEEAVETLVALRKSGFDPLVVDYVAATPSVDELKKLSMNLPSGSLVRRYDPLFRDLRLDDRFIGQTDFWTGIVENPTLINGPILASANRACLCQSDAVMTDFLESIFPGHARPAPETKSAPERAVTPASGIMAGEAVAANVETSAPALGTIEPAAPPPVVAARKTSKVSQRKSAGIKTAAAAPEIVPTGKTSKVLPKKKVAGIKTAAAKATKGATRKPALKQPRTKAK